MPSNSVSSSKARGTARLCLLALCAALLGALASSSVQAQAPAPSQSPRGGQPVTGSPSPRSGRSDEVGNDERTRAARALFDAGTIAFRQGRYEDALGNFEQAYRLTQDPVLLFNVATSLDRLRRDAEAVKQFRAYLEAMPDAPNRSAVEGRIALLSRGVSEDPAPVPAAPVVNPEPPPPAPVVVAPPPPPVTPRERPAHSWQKLPRWVVFSGLGATAVVGGVTLWSGLDTLSAAGDYEDKPTRKAYREGEDLQKRTNILIFTTAGVGVLTAVAAVFTDWRGQGSNSEKAATRGPKWNAWADRNGAGATVEAAF